MIDADFVTAIRQGAGPAWFTIDNRQRLILPPGWSDATPAFATPKPLVVHHLQALVDYVKLGDRGDDTGRRFVVIVSPTQVEVVSTLEDEDRAFRRRVFLMATVDRAPTLPLNTFVDAEQFTIGLLTGFDPGGDRHELLSLVASIRESTVRETIDSGVAQEVKTGRGVALVGNTPVRNPWHLAPHRSFSEVAPAWSDFVLRLRSTSKDGVDKPLCALLETDGGEWTMQATAHIRDWLINEALPVPVIG